MVQLVKHLMWKLDKTAMWCKTVTSEPGVEANLSWGLARLLFQNKVENDGGRHSMTSLVVLHIYLQEQKHLYTHTPKIEELQLKGRTWLSVRVITCIYQVLGSALCTIQESDREGMESDW